MNVVCLDMEGVLYPEIWIAFSEESGIPELRRTTRDEPDYDKLMKWRMGILREHGLKLRDVQNTIAKIRPLPGAKEFLDELRSITQVIILSDTFSQFAQPLMEQLGWPTIFCNELVIDDEGYIADIKMVVANKATARTIFAKNGYKMIDVNLNDGTVGKEMYIGYTTTIHEKDAITAIGERWFNAAGRNPLDYVGDYHKYEFGAVTDFDDNQHNTNEGGERAARWVYLYTSNDENAGAPIKAIEVLSYDSQSTESKLSNNGEYKVVVNSNDNGLADFNRGAVQGNSKRIYIRYKK